MSPDVLYLLVCGAAGVGGWFLHHVWPGTPAGTAGGTLVDVLGRILHTHVANQSPAPALSPDAAALVALVERLLAGQQAMTPAKS